MLRTIERILLGTSAVTIAGLTVLVVVDVALGAARLPTYVSSELSPFLMAMIVFFSIPTVTREEGHIRADFCDTFLSPRARTAIDLFLSGTLFLVYAAVLFWISADLALTSFLGGERSQGLLRTPVWIPQTAMALGLLALLLRTAILLARRAAQFRHDGAARQAGTRP
jgi:TRAP-type C4-dicarboxylate transport system permease small subunit